MNSNPNPCGEAVAALFADHASRENLRKRDQYPHPVVENRQIWASGILTRDVPLPIAHIRTGTVYCLSLRANGYPVLSTFYLAGTDWDPITKLA